MYKFSEEIILASGSPRRSEMLQSAGILFKKIVTECDETPVSGESPETMVRRLSLLKASVGAESNPNTWVLGADTIVVLDGLILGKPADKKEARWMLEKIQGRWHEVWGGFSFVHRSKNINYTESHMSKVKIIPLSSDEIDSYIETGEPMDKAGAYAIQGIGASIVSEVNGSYTNVVGLNLSAVISALRKLHGSN